MTLRVLLVEDDAHVRQFIREALAVEGFEVLTAASLSEAQAVVQHSAIDLVLLDLGLPDGDGEQLLREVRRQASLPVIIVSARDQEVQKIRLLDAGADDYLTKPFGVGELLARVRANLRRPRAATADGRAADDADPVFRFGEVAVDRQARVVRRQGVEVHLTPIEYRLLLVLIANAGRVLTHRQLLREVWGPAHADQSHYLRIYMGHLRQKLESNPAQPQHLLTETAVGYRLLVAS